MTLFCNPFDVFADDLDGDGDIDVIASYKSENKLVWYANNGSESFTLNTISTSIDGPTGLHVSDLDQDGDKDIVVAVDDGDKISYFDNNGSELIEGIWEGLSDDGSDYRLLIIKDPEDDFLLTRKFIKR